MERFIIKAEGEVFCLEAFGFTFEQALENACVAVSSTLGPQASQAAPHEHVKLECRAPNLQELCSVLLSDLLAQSADRELVVKEAAIEEFCGHAQGGGVYARLVGYAGTLEDTQVSKEPGEVEILPDGVKQNELGGWTISALVRPKQAQTLPPVELAQPSVSLEQSLK